MGAEKEATSNPPVLISTATHVDELHPDITPDTVQRCRVQSMTALITMIRTMRQRGEISLENPMGTTRPNKLPGDLKEGWLK